MKEKIQRKAPKPVLHGFLFGNGTFITPAEMKIMQSLGVIPSTKNINSKIELGKSTL